MVRPLTPWFENSKKRQVKAPKVYVRDSGLLHAILGIDRVEDLLGHPLRPSPSFGAARATAVHE
jgi:predicted AAA+ superfamily ATPase